MTYFIRQLDLRDESKAVKEFTKINSTKEGIKIMALKSFNIFIKIKNIDDRAANIIKQEMLARDGDAAISRNALYKTGGSTDIIIFGTHKNLHLLAEKIKSQPFGLKQLSKNLSEHLNRSTNTLKKIKIASKVLDLDKGPLIMGILNITLDSFFDGSKYLIESDINKRIAEIAAEGADIIDVGGMSTRPFSEAVCEEDEIKRVIPVIEHIAGNYDILISVDTYRSNVAKHALEAGAHIINDISGLSFDLDMKKIVKEYNATAVLMHMKGKPSDMQINPSYEDVVGEIYEYLEKRTADLIEYGIGCDKLIIDPGLGFGKTVEHNFEILRSLKDFSYAGFSLLVGASRKSFTGNMLGLEPKDRLEPSLAIASYAALNGADILRVHDVKETIRAIEMIKLIKNA